MHLKGWTKQCRITELPWIELLCTVWPGRDYCSGPQSRAAVLTHHNCRAGDPCGCIAKILLLQCFILMPVSIVDKKPRFHSTKCLSYLSKLLRNWSQFVRVKMDDVCKTGTLQWTGQEAPLCMLDRYITSLISQSI